MKDYQLLLMDDQIEQDQEIQKELKEFQDTINEEYLEALGYKIEQVITDNNIVFETVEDMYYIHTEHVLGNLIADAYRYAINDNNLSDGNVDVAIVPAGVIRGTFLPGEITVSDIFNTFSLGIGPDGKMGYPLIKVYLTGEELKTIAEMDASVSDFMNAARLYLSGLTTEFTACCLILN